MCWTGYLLRKHLKLQSALGKEGSGHDLNDYTSRSDLDKKIYFQYYVQDDTEVGTLMDTKISMKEVWIRSTFCIFPLGIA